MNVRKPGLVLVSVLAPVVLATAFPALAADAPSGPSAIAADRADPAEKFNRKLFAVHQFLDRAFFRPLAMAYKAITPPPLRQGIENVISNLGEPVVLVNDVLQGHFRKAGGTTVRFVTNSTIGIAGLVDVAKAANLPHHDNGFALTLGRAGVKSGPYLFIPLMGPSTVRDAIGNGIDALTSPYPWFLRGSVETDYIVSKTVVGGIDTRASIDGEYTALLADATDPYATLRSVYLQNQQSKIDDTGTGTAPPSALPDFDDATTPTAAGSTPPSGAAPSDTTPTTPPPPADAPSGPQSGQPAATPAS
jgi:phospholipid-binding lipoprotein MlaA